MNFFLGSTAATAIIAWGAPSFQELFVILVIVLIVFGAKRLPELARALGQSMNEFRKAKDEFEKELHKPTPSSPSPSHHSSLEASQQQQAGAPIALPPQAPAHTVPINSPSSAEKRTI